MRATTYTQSTSHPLKTQFNGPSRRIKEVEENWQKTKKKMRQRPAVSPRAARKKNPGLRTRGRDLTPTDPRQGRRGVGGGVPRTAAAAKKDVATSASLRLWIAWWTFLIDSFPDCRSGTIFTRKRAGKDGRGNHLYEPEL